LSVTDEQDLFLTQQIEQAVRLREAKQYEEALQLLVSLYKADPQNPLVNYHCAWTCDALGREGEAVPFYKRAIENGLAGEDLKGALLGLGSTYRCLGQYEESAQVLRQGVQKFPESRQFEAFLALTLYNLGDHASAMELLIRNLAETSKDESIRRYRRALLFYADKLDETWA
jgi:tetratricopeptide (TPR) repeat protein